MQYTLFTKGFRGLYANINGKMCFPDRSFVNPEEGLVQVHSLKDHNTYAFITGCMMKAATDVSFKLVEEYLKNIGLPYDLMICKNSWGTLIQLDFEDTVQVLVQSGNTLVTVLDAVQGDYTTKFLSAQGYWSRRDDWFAELLKTLAEQNPMTEDEIYWTQVRYQEKDEEWKVFKGAVVVKTRYGAKDRFYYKTSRGDIMSRKVYAADFAPGSKPCKTLFKDILSFRKEYGLAIPNCWEEEQQVIHKDLWVNGCTEKMDFYNSWLFDKAFLEDASMVEQLKGYGKAYSSLIKSYGATLTSKTASNLATIAPANVLGGGTCF